MDRCIGLFDIKQIIKANTRQLPGEMWPTWWYLVKLWIFSEFLSVIVTVRSISTLEIDLDRGLPKLKCGFGSEKSIRFISEVFV